MTGQLKTDLATYIAHLLEAGCREDEIANALVYAQTSPLRPLIDAAVMNDK